MAKENQVVNNSGKGKEITVPDIVKNRFNWGAFFLGWIWGIGNKSYLTFISFATILVCWLPVVGPLIPIGLSIWFGLKGNEWAWQNKKFASVEVFHNYQKKWAIVGIVIVILSILIMTTLFGTVMAELGKAYRG